MGAAENAPPGAGNNKAGGSRGRLVAERLSRDHKPESAGELERIQAAGGVVFPLPTRRDVAAGGGNGVIESTFPPAAGRDFGVGVPRVWRAGGDGPGLAMSRSIGDKVTLGAPRGVRCYRWEWVARVLEFVRPLFCSLCLLQFPRS